MNKENLKISLSYLLVETDKAIRYFKNRNVNFDVEEFFRFYKEVVEYLEKNKLKLIADLDLVKFINEIPDLSEEISRETNRNLTFYSVLKLCLMVLFPPYIIIFLYKQSKQHTQIMNKLASLKDLLEKIMERLKVL